MRTTFAPLHGPNYRRYFVGQSLQLGSVPQMRGRVMSLWGLAVMGSTAIGAPAIGAVASADSPRAGLALGAAACALSAGVGWSANRRREVSSAQAAPYLANSAR